MAVIRLGLQVLQRCSMTVRASTKARPIGGKGFPASAGFSEALECAWPAGDIWPDNSQTRLESPRLGRQRPMLARLG